VVGRGLQSSSSNNGGASWRGLAVTADIAYVSEVGREPGLRKANQQAAMCCTHTLGIPRSACVGVLDGHGPLGHLVRSACATTTLASDERTHPTRLNCAPMPACVQVVEFVRERLPAAVRTSEGEGAGSPGERFGAALTGMHTQLQGSAIDCEFSGCTVRARSPAQRLLPRDGSCADCRLRGIQVAAVLLTPGELHCAWLGDVRVLLGSEHADGTLHTQQLTNDGHYPNVRSPAPPSPPPHLYRHLRTAGLRRDATTAGGARGSSHSQLQGPRGEAAASTHGSRSGGGVPSMAQLRRGTLRPPPPQHTHCGVQEALLIIVGALRCAPCVGAGTRGCRACPSAARSATTLPTRWGCRAKRRWWR
jgi:serine/threonine protein phosphatase PrpC